MLSSLIATKLYIPPLRPDHISRQRLVDLLDSGYQAGRRLTLVSAPAGYGKTSLLSEWHVRLTELQVPLVWLSLEETDNDPQRFLHYLVAALRTIFPRFGQHLNELLNLPQLPALMDLATEFINEIGQQNAPLILALDDYHLVINPAIHEVVGLLVDRGPANLHVVIASRHDPLLPLPRLRARGQVTELRLKDLRFRNEEADAFLRKGARLGLPAHNLAALQERTEGWAAGLQLAAISLADGETSSDQFIQNFTGDDRHILDYLLEEVLSRQSADVQQFLLDTSILEKFCSGLCTAVWGAADKLQMPDGSGNAVPTGQSAGQILDELDRFNLFLIPLDNRREWFRYHHLFSEALRHRLQRQNPARYIENHRRAAQWFDQNGLPAPAFEHAMAARDTGLAADIAERWLDPLIYDGQIALSKSWFNLLPRTLVQERPELLFRKTRVYSMLGDPDTSLKALDELQSCLEKMADPFPRRAALWTLHYTSRAGMMISRGYLDKATECLKRAAEWLPPDDMGLQGLIIYYQAYVCLSQGDVEKAEANFMEMFRISLSYKSYLGVFDALATAMECAVYQGKALHAAQMADDFLADYLPEVKDLPNLSMVYAEMGNTAYALNQLERAESLLQQALAQSQLGGIGDSYGRWRTQLAVVKSALGKFDEVERLLKEAEPWLTRSTNERANRRTRTYWARIRFQQGNLAEAALWAERYQAEMNQPYRQDYADNTLARIWISQGKVLEALQLMENRAPGLQEKKLILFLIENLALQAVVLQRLGHQGEAFETIQRALHLAESENLQRVFLDLGFELALLLSRFKSSLGPGDALQVFLGQILAGLSEADRAALPSIEAPMGSGPVSSGKEEWVEALSEREIEVLRWMARGLSNMQIADQMVVAESTVKKHINHIFGKLDAENRTQALIKARERGLL